MTKDEWIRYKGHPYQIRELTEASLRVIDAVTTDIITIYRDDFTYVELIQAPAYQVDDMVLYKGEVARVIRQNSSYVFFKYEIKTQQRYELVSPFQITKIDY